MRCSVIVVAIALLAVGAAAADVANCAEYCDLTIGYAATCPSNYAAYFNIGALSGTDNATLAFQMTACLANCAAWPTSSGAQSGAFFECRAYHLGVAASNPVGDAQRILHCGHAGPLPTGACGTAVEAFANLHLAVCGVKPTSATGVYTSVADVVQQLMYTPTADATGVDAAIGNSAQVDNVQCRAYHTVAVASGAVTAAAHCSHGARISITCNSGLGGYGVLPLGDGICDAYCDDYIGACASNPTFIYPVGTFGASPKGACMQVCAALPTGTAADMGGNTQGCRAYHSGVSAQSSALAATHCQHGGYGDGPQGEVHCGNACDFYCSVNQHTCSAAQGNTFADTASCLMYCNGIFPNPKNLTETATHAASLTGVAPDDTVVCRAYHTTAALVTGAAVHCQHANKYGGTYPTGGICGTPGMTYADANVAICAPLNVLVPMAGLDAWTLAYATSEALLPGSISDTAGDTLACRQYHIEAAAGALWAATPDPALAAVHCAHAQGISTAVSATGIAAGPCGTTGANLGCDFFCDLGQTVCPGVYSTRAVCMTECQAYVAGNTVPIGDTDTDSLSCRFYHLTVAAGAAFVNNTALQATHCPHSGKVSATCTVAIVTATGTAPSTDTGVDTGLSGSSAAAFGASVVSVALVVAALLL